MATNDNNKHTTSQDKNLGLASISYADYVILSSTLSFAISEEVNDADLDMIIAFISMIVSDLVILRTRRGIINSQLDQGEEGILGAEDVNASSDIVVGLGRKNKRRKKCIRKVKKIK